MYENEMLAFLTYDEEHHRIALLQIPETKNKDPQTCGLEHIAFTFNTLTDLLLSYRQRKKRGIRFGPSTTVQRLQFTTKTPMGI